MTPTDQEHRPVLEYGGPPRPVSVWRVLLGVAGVATGIAAIPLVVVGSLGILALMNPDVALPAPDVLDGLPQAIAVSIVGVMLATISWACCRGAFRRRRRDTDSSQETDK